MFVFWKVACCGFELFTFIFNIYNSAVVQLQAQENVPICTMRLTDCQNFVFFPFSTGEPQKMMAECCYSKTSVPRPLQRNEIALALLWCLSSDVRFVLVFSFVGRNHTSWSTFQVYISDFFVLLMISTEVFFDWFWWSMRRTFSISFILKGQLVWSASSSLASLGLGQWKLSA